MSLRIFLQSLTVFLGGFAPPAMAQIKPNSLFKPLDTGWRILQISLMSGAKEHLFFPALNSR